MKKISLLLSIILFQTAVMAQSTYKSDKPHSRLSFSITHMGINDVTGVFKDFGVTVQSAKNDFSDATFELTVSVASINTDVEMRDNHLKTADFFDVATYPEMTFKSTSIKKTGKDRYQLSGNLTLHGVTKPVAMNLWYRGSTINPMSKAPTYGFQLTGKIKRSDFGIGPKFPAPMLSEEVSIKADGEFVKS